MADRDIYSGDILFEKNHMKHRKNFNLWHFVQNINWCKTIAY